MSESLYARPLSLVSTFCAALLIGGSLIGCGLLSRDEEPAKAGRPAAAPKAAGKQTAKVNKIAWYGGLKLTFGEVAYDPEGSPELTASVLVENLSDRDYDPDLPVLFSIGGQQFDGSFEQSSMVGAKQQSKLDLGFQILDKLTAKLNTGEFIIGRGTETQSKMPVGDGELVANEPRTVLTATGKITHRDLNVWFKSCDLRADIPQKHDQAKSGQVFVLCLFDVQYTGGEGVGHSWDDAHLRLKLPDGTTTAPTANTSEALYSAAIVPDEYAAFMIPAPASGKYAIQIVDVHFGKGEKPTPASVKEIPLPL